MGLVAKLHGIQGPAGFIPTATLVHFATQIPIVRDEVIAELVKSGHLARIGLRKVSWWSRMWAPREKALPATAG